MPKPAVARFAFAALAAALLLAACGGDEPAPATPTATLSPAAPSVTRTPGPSAAVETLTPTPTGAAVNAKLLSIEQGGQFPSDTAIIVETGCWGCDGPTQSLVRVYQRPDGDFTQDTLLDPATLPYKRRLTISGSVTYASPFITGYVTSPDASEIIVSLCVQDACGSGGLDAWSPNSSTTFLRSTDGGITWEEWSAFTSGAQVELYLGPGKAVMASWDADLQVNFWSLPSFQRIGVPEGGRGLTRRPVAR